MLTTLVRSVLTRLRGRTMAAGGGVHDTTPPTLVSAAVDGLGTTLTLMFSEAVTGHAGFVLKSDGTPVSITYVSGVGTAVLTYSVG